ncbi:thiamine pyrophosphate-dependent enzyme [Streptomyces sp. NPDC051940]|uniref:thiamine pyrophosphate-dependent enzyme n=1 Tax=Streptomyces sp. NPDC051940 TaxID=3155675 RepID=UPI0034170D30
MYCLPSEPLTTTYRPAADRASAHGIPARVVDGNDVETVRDAVALLAGRARAGEGPGLLECETYRHYGHSRADPAAYRPDGELEHWLKHDPLDLARGRLHDLGVAPDLVMAADERAARTVADAVDAAKAAPGPDPATALTDVWADGGAAWRT